MWNNYCVARGRRWMIQLLSYSVVERRVRLEIGRSTPALEAKQHIRWSLPPRQTLNSSNKHTCASERARLPPGHLTFTLTMQQVYYTICKKAPTTMAARNRERDKASFAKSHRWTRAGACVRKCVCVLNDTDAAAAAKHTTPTSSLVFVLIVQHAAWVACGGNLILEHNKT